MVETLTQRIHEVDVRPRLDAMDQRFDAMDQRFDAMDQRFDAMEKRFDAIDEKLIGLDHRLHTLEQRVERVEARLLQVEAGLTGMRQQVWEELGRLTLRLASLEVAVGELAKKLDAAREDMDQRFRLLNDRVGGIEQLLAAA
jgi:archaellum component FlaC